MKSDARWSFTDLTNADCASVFGYSYKYTHIASRLEEDKQEQVKLSRSIYKLLALATRIHAKSLEKFRKVRVHHKKISRSTGCTARVPRPLKASYSGAHQHSESRTTPATVVFAR